MRFEYLYDKNAVGLSVVWYRDWKWIQINLLGFIFTIAWDK